MEKAKTRRGKVEKISSFEFPWAPWSEMIKPGRCYRISSLTANSLSLQKEGEAAEGTHVLPHRPSGPRGVPTKAKRVRNVGFALS